MVWNAQTLIEDVGIFSYEIWGNSLSITINSITPINKKTSCKDLSFCTSEGDDAIRDISTSNAGVILCNKSVKPLLWKIEEQKHLQCLVILDNPRLSYNKNNKSSLQTEKKRMLKSIRIVQSHVGPSQILL